MKRCLTALALILFSAPASAQLIEVGRAKWDKLPELQKAERRLPYEVMVSQVEQMLADRRCVIPGQTSTTFDITVPYAVLLQPDGKLSRVVVAEMQCEPLETLVGETAIGLAELGDFRSPGGEKPRWYASEINFTLQ